VQLPAGSTPVDLAYTLSTRTGHGCVGAQRGGRLIPLSSTLVDGDVVEVISQSPITLGPSQEWLDFVKTPHARLQIDRWFAAGGEPATIAHRVKLGRAAIRLALRQRDRLLADDTPLLAIAVQDGFPDLDALLVAVANRDMSADELVERMIAVVDRAGVIAPD
jgi:GTP pyrophosphokinase